MTKRKTKIEGSDVAYISPELNINWLVKAKLTSQLIHVLGGS